ncbi:hypothetical protein [Halostagnicola kamekurae]|uniref:Uncharacterized protein n=1 Tax=Halostagnicola kamekurae TaxID=619731 RepID=A0A1I6TPW2_9EURY|nr:hypothetical protein [Halostagnicola kamekurae]SFS91210.1 hypothetical protein SAMN04488556_3299 [Halostagnicola kamekurae]
MPSRQGLDLERGERLHYRGGLRSADEVAVTETRLLVKSDDELTSVPYTNVESINNESFDWFLAIMSAALVVFGAYSMTMNPLVGAGFVVAGLWSIRRSYRHRNRVRIHTHSQPKPVEIFPEDVEALYDELEPAIEAVRAEESEDGEDETDSEAAPQS